MINFDNIGNVIRKYRKSRAKTQGDMAQYLDITMSQYANLEKGKSLLNIEQLACIANILMIPVVELTTGFTEDAEILEAMKVFVADLERKIAYYESKHNLT
jgi:transcriptional regulator with XRE-family HTH domain